jgi:hypothetical protein
LLPKEIQAGSAAAEVLALWTIHLMPLRVREVLEEVLLEEHPIREPLRRRRQIQAVVLVQVLRMFREVLVVEVQVLFV